METFRSHPQSFKMYAGDSHACSLSPLRPSSFAVCGCLSDKQLEGFGRQLADKVYAIQDDVTILVSMEIPDGKCHPKLVLGKQPSFSGRARILFL